MRLGFAGADVLDCGAAVEGVGSAGAADWLVEFDMHANASARVRVREEEAPSSRRVLSVRRIVTAGDRRGERVYSESW